MKRALVTGGSGFIGSEIIQELRSRGYEIVSLDIAKPKEIIEGVEYIHRSTGEMDGLRKAGENVDFIFHTAGILGTSLLLKDIPKSVEVNIRGGINVLELAKETGAVMINLGLIPEWNSPYMITKNSIEQFGKVYNEYCGTDVRTIQLTHAYGPKQSPYQGKAVPNFIINSLLGRNLFLFGEEGGEFKFMDLIHSKDAAKAIIKIAENPNLKREILQLGCGQGIPVDELARKIIDLCGNNCKIVYMPMRRGEPPGREKDFRNADLSKWSMHFSEPPTEISLDAGIKNTIDGYKKDLENNKIDISRVIVGE